MTIDEVVEAGAPPIMAILRGIAPEAAIGIAEVLIAEGIRLIEIPFNSPHAARSITMLSDAFSEVAVIGGGTVVSCEAVDALADARGKFMVAPNTDVAVIHRCFARGIEPLPGFQTPSEAFQAVAAGARRLKLFPAMPLGTEFLAAVLEVLPSTSSVWSVGGMCASNINSWLDAGAEGVGLGGALFRPGDGPFVIAGRAREVVASWRAVRG